MISNHWNKCSMCPNKSKSCITDTSFSKTNLRVKRCIEKQNNCSLQLMWALDPVAPFKINPPDQYIDTPLYAKKCKSGQTTRSESKALRDPHLLQHIAK